MDSAEIDLSYFRNLSERQRGQDAERALAASEERFRVAFEDAAIGMAIVRPDMVLIRVNRSMCRILGYSEEEILGTTLIAITHPDDREANVALIERALAGEMRTFELEKRYFRKDGGVVWALLCVSLIRHEDGSPRYFLSQIQDITARKEAETEQATTHQRTREVLERITDNFYALDRDWRITYLNEATARLARRSREELTGTDFWQYSTPVSREALFPVFTKAMTSGEPQAVEFVHPPGETWYEVRAYPSADGLSVFFRDISERKRHAEELQEALAAAQAANRTQNRFLAMMSHELRTPLQAILGYADLLLSEQAGALSSEQREDIHSIRQGAGRMSGLIDQVLDLSRMGAGALELAASSVDLTKILQQVRQDVAPQAAAKELALHIDLPAGLPAARGDPMRVRQILLNLVSNAVKYTDRGAVRVTAAAQAAEVAIAVSDTGIGISPALMPHIFEEFRQGESGAIRRYEGAGLGLTIAQRLAEQMGGRISVTSQLGVGSTFTLHLPAFGKPDR